jgi:hypothetical protein
VSAFLCVVLPCVGRGLVSKESYQLSNGFTSKNPSTLQGKRRRLRKEENLKSLIK